MTTRSKVSAATAERVTCPQCRRVYTASNQQITLCGNRRYCSTTCVVLARQTRERKESP